MRLNNGLVERLRITSSILFLPEKKFSTLRLHLESLRVILLASSIQILFLLLRATLRHVFTPPLPDAPIGPEAPDYLFLPQPITHISPENGWAYAMYLVPSSPPPANSFSAPH